MSFGNVVTSVSFFSSAIASSVGTSAKKIIKFVYIIRQQIILQKSVWTKCQMRFWFERLLISRKWGLGRATSACRSEHDCRLTHLIAGRRLENIVLLITVHQRCNLLLLFKKDTCYKDMRILRGSRVSRVFAFLLATVLTMTMHGSSSSSEDTSNFVVVETSSGKVLGRKEGNLNVYLGIPYAEPPVGRYRFRPPRRKSPWYPATYRALDFAPECLQSALYTSDPDEDVSRTAGMDEDCLYLNIWQPAKGQKAARDNLPLLPVMIWIYGGAFLHGSASKPEYFGNKLASSRNVIIVSLNYRLGALGFLVSTADGLYGNYGLDDQKTAIQWVKKNIIHFGGDPDRITLFGESAGAMSIGLHMLDQEKRMKRQYRRTATTRSSSSGAQYDSDTHTTTGRSRGYEDDADIGDDDSSEGEDEEGEAYSRSEYRGEDAHKLFHAVILQSNPLGYK